MDGWSLVWWGACTAFALYAIALGVFALVRHRSANIAERTAGVWRHELWITTWILAMPGLVAAAYGVLIMIGFVLLPLGLAVGVIATRVALGRRSIFWWLPLAFVGLVDLIVGVSLITAADSVSLSDLAATAGLVLYLGLATANAVRILTRGRASGRGPKRPTERSAKVQAVSRPPSPAPERAPGAFEPPVDLYRSMATRSS